MVVLPYNQLLHVPRHHAFSIRMDRILQLGVRISPSFFRFFLVGILSLGVEWK